MLTSEALDGPHIRRRPDDKCALRGRQGQQVLAWTLRDEHCLRSSGTESYVISELADGHPHSLSRDTSLALNQDISGLVVEIAEQRLGFAWGDDAKTSNRVLETKKMIPKC
jgi:hypothetical protein